LKNYIEQELEQRHVLLLNKSDYLSTQQRKIWSRHLNDSNITHLFFSATQEQSISDDSGNHVKEETILPFNTDQIFTRRELLLTLQSLDKKEKLMLGTVRFPNVSKSSVINVLLGIQHDEFQRKRVGVVFQPGKTKHFQTLTIPNEHLIEYVTLCDCPGLVFPSFKVTKASLIANGVFSIHSISFQFKELLDNSKRLLLASFGVIEQARQCGPN